MRTLPLLAALALLLALAGCQPVRRPLALPAAAPTATTTPVPTAAALPTPAARVTVTLAADSITSQALAGNLLGDPAARRFYVLLPPSYAAGGDAGTQRYPAVYVLPWGASTPESNVADFKRVYARLLAAGRLPELILVFPDGSNTLGASLFRSSPTIGDYERYLTEELVAYVDNHYRTLPARESRGLAGCSNGGDATVRIALTYPAVFGAAASGGGLYDQAMATNPLVLQELPYLHTLPAAPSEIRFLGLSQAQWFLQNAAGSAPNPDLPPLYFDLPYRLVDGKAEIVPEVAARIAAGDAVHAAAAYMQQPYRLSGLLLQHALGDVYYPTETVRGFSRLLAELGIAHEYEEFAAAHCGHPWEESALLFLARHLAGPQPR
jgi:enterochelin esterase-like enzyme